MPKTHGLGHSKLPQTFYSIQRRCTNKNYHGYKNYGGRGIKFEWKSASDFINDMQPLYEKALKQYPNELLSIDRINVNGNYSKANCRWIPHRQQPRNKRTNHWLTFRGECMIIDDWAKKTGINKQTLLSRLRSRWSLSDVLLKPVRTY